MKKHHSIFGTKSIPDYRKKEFRKGRNRRQAENKKNSNDYSGDTYDAWNDEGSYSEGSYNEESYDDAAYYEDSYDDDPYNEVTKNKVTNEDDVRRESLESVADDHIEAGTDSDDIASRRQNTEDLEDAIYNAAEESSGAYQNLDDTVLIGSVVNREKGSDRFCRRAI